MSAVPVSVNVHGDLSEFTAKIEKYLRHQEDFYGGVDVRHDLEDTFHQLYQRAVALDAGVEGRWYVRGAMDPAYAAPRARDSRIRALTRQGRYAAAAALIRGWVEHR